MYNLTRTPSNNNSTALMPAGVDADSTSRPRNRRGPSTNDHGGRSKSAPRLTPGTSPAPSRGVSPMPSAHLSSTKLAWSGRSSPSNTSFSKGLLEGSWAPSWTSVQDFASSLIAGVESGYNSETSRPNSRSGSKTRQRSAWKGLGAAGSSRKLPESWGPAPPTNPSRPKAEDIAAGSLAERETALNAMKKASILQSYEGVNGGLDVGGKYKRRNSDENPGTVSEPAVEEQLVYLHHVQPNDTYAGIVLRYRCQEHIFRKTNGLWSRDNIQVRKYLMMPVDSCEAKGRPCDPPTCYNDKNVDHLAKTPQPESFIQSGAAGSSQTQQTLHDDFFGSPNGKSQSLPDEEQPWTHVKWVKLDSFSNPIEIVRVSRKAMGFFPPRRKKSVHTVSNFSTPRHSLEFHRGMAAGSSEPGLDSPGRLSSRRQSSMSGRPTSLSLGTSPSAGRSRGNSLGPADGVPAWMRRPGGVGSMSRSVKAPGPANDYFNTWVNKRLPKGFNIDNMPSISVMGSESASWGFSKNEEAAGIVESPFEDGREAPSTSQQGAGLEQAAASIETWLRGAWAKRPATPRLSSNRKPVEDLDLIELTDTNSDDGRSRIESTNRDTGLQSPQVYGSTGRSDGDGTVRGAQETHDRAAAAAAAAMPICIECRHPVKTLWTQYSGAGGPSSGHNIRLTVCKKCGRFCDKYVEHDFVVLFIDLVLIKPQVYRHLLHNTLMRERDRFDPSIVRLGTLLLLFDVYLTWARIEKQTIIGGGGMPDGGGVEGEGGMGEGMLGGQSNLGGLARRPIVLQYMFFLILCTFSTLAFHLSIRFLTSSPWSPLNGLGVLNTYPRPNSVSTALLVSSSTKLFPILMVVWDYDVPAAARSLGWAVVLNNVEALKILLDCGYPIALVLAAAGAVARWVVGRAILWMVGLQGVISIGESGVAADGKALWAAMVYVRDWAVRLAVGLG
ncbi:Arv1-like family-domain-containing protein [Pseudomassariella vexata]|uniref:Protein ARV n=1 Tax=Pseudomassariella vexata TaxID=1141098 RepID=A0A1Y2DUZ4_9PEZI|nr:Arv1-like family-domain-containing protein [Pseudomassariella vexata]ORY63091.1 Arv1-like family-domain-containing protein [Pseudomassariella vexata]